MPQLRSRFDAHSYAHAYRRRGRHFEFVRRLESETADWARYCSAKMPTPAAAGPPMTAEQVMIFKRDADAKLRAPLIQR